MTGEISHKISMGPATASAAGIDSSKTSAVEMAITGAVHIDRKEAARPVRPLRSVALDGSHSRRRLRVISIRPAARAIASRLNIAS